jgi:hypothetical protein
MEDIVAKKFFFGHLFVDSKAKDDDCPQCTWFVNVTFDTTRAWPTSGKLEVKELAEGEMTSLTLSSGAHAEISRFVPHARGAHGKDFAGAVRFGGAELVEGTYDVTIKDVTHDGVTIHQVHVR